MTWERVRTSAMTYLHDLVGVQDWVGRLDLRLSRVVLDMLLAGLLLLPLLLLLSWLR